MAVVLLEDIATEVNGLEHDIPGPLSGSRTPVWSLWDGLEVMAITGPRDGGTEGVDSIEHMQRTLPHALAFWLLHLLQEDAAAGTHGGCP